MKNDEMLKSAQTNNEEKNKNNTVIYKHAQYADVTHIDS